MNIQKKKNNNSNGRTESVISGLSRILYLGILIVTATVVSNYYQNSANEQNIRSASEIAKKERLRIKSELDSLKTFYIRIDTKAEEQLSFLRAINEQNKKYEIDYFNAKTENDQFDEESFIKNNASGDINKRFERIRSAKYKKFEE